MSTILPEGFDLSTADGETIESLRQALELDDENEE